MDITPRNVIQSGVYMLNIAAKTTYIDPEVYESSECRRRLEEILPYMKCDDIRSLEPDTMQQVFEIGKRRHGKDDFGDDSVVVFTTFNNARRKWFYHWRDEAAIHGGACQSALELNIVDGCVFRCTYCGFGRYIVFYLDVERLIDGLDECFEQYPSQRLYKYSNMTDLPPFEPELNAIPPMIKRFSLEPHRYLMLFTKSDNVDFMQDLDHRGHTIISWSLTCDTASRLVDKRAASLVDRIGAMAKMQAVGYPVRARLSPIVPLVNWREEYTNLFELLFTQTQPDVITMELLGWMNVDDLLAIFDRSDLDQSALQNAVESCETLRDVRWGPFTQETHEEIYSYCIDEVRRLSPKTAISVCHGTSETWNVLGKKMAMSAQDYICNCGPFSTPGGRLYDRWNGVHSA
jgi:hypothetical protein